MVTHQCIKITTQFQSYLISFQKVTQHVSSFVSPLTRSVCDINHIDLSQFRCYIVFNSVEKETLRDRFPWHVLYKGPNSSGGQ